jgi:UDP-4-amino-4-deoxy-L-arabinose-oxoglutarate aminotransferase
LPRREIFLPFSRPSINDADIAAVRDVLASGWITTGPKVAAFEEEFAKRIGCRYSVSLASATAGMHLFLKALGIGPGDQVITPSMTWVSTVNLIVLCGATPVFIDIDRDTLMAPPEAFLDAVTSRTRLMIPVHFAGAAADVETLRIKAEEAGITIVEDAAHALGTRCRGVPVGQKGHALFSFHPIKNITTGEGGMFCTNDEEAARRMRSLRFHGLGVDAYDRNMQGRAPQAEVLEPGFKYNMTDMAAALGLSQLARLEELNSKRRAIAMLYRERLLDIPEVIPLKDPPYEIEHSWHLFIVRLDTERTGISRDELMRRLKEENIGTGIHFKAVHKQKYYREAMPGVSLPNTEWNSERILSLPLFPDMTEADLEDVLVALKKALAR